MLSFFLAHYHAHDTLAVSQGGHTPSCQVSLSKVLEVADTLKTILAELRSVLLEVKTSQPFIDTHVFDLVFNIKQALRIGDGTLDIVSVLEEVAL